MTRPHLRRPELPAALAVGGRPPRMQRVAKQLRQELSMLVLQDMKDPRVRMASITSVDCSSDLRSARVMVSAMGSDRERREVVQALRHAEGFLRGQLYGRLENLKSVPRMQFELDESIAYSVHVAEVLRKLGTTDQVAREREAAASAAVPPEDPL